MDARLMYKYRGNILGFRKTYITFAWKLLTKENNMKHSIEAAWKGNMKFSAEMDGHTIVVDAGADAGGQDAGPRPKKLMMLALAGCTGMDVVSLLNKMRVEFDDFSLSVDANVTEEHPKHYDSMHITYRFKGKNLPMDKLQKVVEMSQEKYCGVSAAYKKAMEITWEIVVIPD
jgi:putative redox protein